MTFLSTIHLTCNPTLCTISVQCLIVFDCSHLHKTESSGCGSAGRAVASNTRGPWPGIAHLKNCQQIILLCLNYNHPTF